MLPVPLAASWEGGIDRPKGFLKPDRRRRDACGERLEYDRRDWFGVAVCVIAFIEMTRWKWGIIPVVLGAGLLGVICKFFILLWDGKSQSRQLVAREVPQII